MHQVPYEKGETLLDAAKRAGIEPPFSCEEDTVRPASLNWSKAELKCE